MFGRRVRIGVAAIGATVALAAPGSALGATQLGQTFVPEDTFSAGWTGIQAVAPNNQYTAPSPGVITSWSFQAAATDVPQGLKLKVARSAGAPNFTIVGESTPKNPVAGTLNTYTDVRIPVQAGDSIGLFMGSVDAFTFTFRDVDSGFGEFEQEGDFVPGNTTAYDGPFELQLDVSASLEADADGDGFGDETQDQCPTDGSTQGPCPDKQAPTVTITKGAPDKLEKSKVKFKFESNEPGSTFECKFDKQDFKPCTSPRKYKRLGGGKHKFKVIATDPAGNSSDPAKDKFKVV